MFENVKLDKSMYHLSNKSFLESLTEQDPDDNYIGTPYEGLDAFERQLKRFDIKTSGLWCDKVEKFFVTSESAVLFPEFVKRCVREGLESTVLKDLFATVTTTSAVSYNPTVITDTGSFATSVSQGGTFGTTDVTSSTTTVAIPKFGRIVSASYEFLRSQKLDMFALILRNTGKKIGNGALSIRFPDLFDSLSPVVTVTAATLSYNNIIAMLSDFPSYKMTTLITSVAQFAALMKLPELADCKPNAYGKVILPFGAELIAINGLITSRIVGFDKDYALELIAGEEIIVDTDKLITTQTDVVSIGYNITARRIYDDAIRTIRVN